MIDLLYTVIIFPIVQILEMVFTFSQQIFKTTGISLIMISAVVSVLCLPVYTVADHWQRREREKTRQMKGTVDKIRAVFKGDERFMVLHTYYRQQRYHPVYALRSSLGVFFQAPFFIAAYHWLSHLEALKGASFLFIHDLSKPDGLIPLGNSMSVNLLPLLMTLINCAAGAIYTKDLSLKEKMPLYGIAALFLVLLYESPAGLVLYWTLNNIFNLCKNIYVKITSPRKTAFLYGIISAAVIIIIVFLFQIKTNVLYHRVIAGACGIPLIICWLVFLFKKHITRLRKKLPVMTFTAAGIFRLFAVSCGVLWIITGVFIPSMMIGSSPQEFSFIDEYTTPLFFIGSTALQAFGFCILWPCCLYALFSVKVKRGFTLLAAALASCALVNIFLFPGNYGLISITLEFSGDVDYSISEILGNILVLLPSMVLPAALIYTRFAGALPVVFALCFASLSAVSAANIVRIETAYRELAVYYKPAVKETVTVKPIIQLSRTGKNVVVIMLDRAVSVFAPYIFEESSALKDIYYGFVYYPNSVSFNGYTRLGSPPIYGGYEATPLEMNKRPDVTMLQKHNEALLMMPRIFSEAGYSVVSTDPPYANYNWHSDISIYDSLTGGGGVKAYITDSYYTEAWLKQHDITIPSSSSLLKRNIIWYSFLRIAPIFLREGIYFKGNWCAPVKNSSLKLMLNGYSVLDFLPRLTGFESQTENTAAFIVNNTTHENAFLQAPEYRPSLNVTNYGTSPFKKEKSYHVNAAALMRLADWFQFLQKEGVYDNTRIIIVSDHGANAHFVTPKTALPFNIEQYNPLLMVKDFAAHGEMTTDKTFMSNADVPHIALAGLFNNPVNPYTGNAITGESKREPLYIAVSGSLHLDKSAARVIKLDPARDYYVQREVLNAENWERALDRQQQNGDSPHR